MVSCGGSRHGGAWLPWGANVPPAAGFRGPSPLLGRLLLDFAPQGNHAPPQPPPRAGGESWGRDEPLPSGGCGLAISAPGWGTWNHGKAAPAWAVGERKRWRSRPISRVLSWTVIPLGASSPIRSSNLPGPDAGRVMRSLFGLAPGGVCRAGPLPDSRCALTAPFHPCHALPEEPFGGLLSVALSVGSRRPGVTWHRALWSPDFPRHSEE